jgi:hypothetical protein
MVWLQGMNCKWTRSFRKLADGKLCEWTPAPRMGRKSVLRSGLVARRVERRDGTGRRGWNPQRNAAPQIQTEGKGKPRRARVLATGTDRGGRGEGRPLSVESGKEMALPPSPPLRTGRETFASSGSSHFKALREQSRCSQRFNLGCPPMNAESLEERTICKIPVPARIERISRAFDLRMSPYLGVGCLSQPQPNDLVARCSVAGVHRKHPASLTNGMPVFAHNPLTRLVRVSAFGPAPETLPQYMIHLVERVCGHN